MNIHNVKVSTDPNRVLIGNGLDLEVKSIGHFKFISGFESNVALHLNDILTIIKNLISVSKFSKNNNAYFEFCSNACFIESHASSVVFHEGLLDESGYITSTTYIWNLQNLA